MNAEFLAVLENIEREKGISRQVLLESVEAALVSAAKKVLHDKDKAPRATGPAGGMKKKPE